MTTVIDWEAKVRDLRRMADELEMVSMREDGRHKMILGRVCDELRQLAGQVEAAMRSAEAYYEDGDWEAEEDA